MRYQPPIQSVYDRLRLEEFETENGTVPSLEFEDETGWANTVNYFLRQGTLGKVGKPPSFNVERKLAAASQTD